VSEQRERRTEGADLRRTRWPGWIWAVPIAAIGVAGWLGIRALVNGGETITLVFDDAYGMKPDDTSVTLRGVTVGEVRDVSLDKDGHHVDVQAELDRSAEPYLRSGTRFWVKGAQFDFSDLSTAKAMLGGPEIVMVPGPGAKTRHFNGSARSYAPAGPTVKYAIRFPGAVGQLEEGAAVRLRGFRVGEVEHVGLRYDASTGTLDTPVEIVLDVAQLGFANTAKPANGNWRPLVDDMLRRLIATGLRARLSQDPPLIGERVVSLDFVPDAPSATLAQRPGETDIPSVGSGDVDAVMAKAEDAMTKADHAMATADHVMAKIDALPIEQTGENIRNITAHIRTLSSSPKLADSLDHLDRSVAQVDRTLREVSPQIGPLVSQLRQTAREADSAVAAANRTIGGDPMRQNDLPEALRQLTDMARSVRALADYLDRHPEALLRGKGGKGQ
jgi:paraquat-inducible protein B